MSPGRVSAVRFGSGSPTASGCPTFALNIATARIYRPSVEYQIVDVNLHTGTIRRERQRADHDGRLHIRLDGDLHEVGIVEEEGPVLTLADFKIAGAGWATAGRRVKLDLHLLNKGTVPAKQVTLSLTSPNEGVAIFPGETEVEQLVPGQSRISPDFSFEVKDRIQAAAAFELHLTDATGRSWQVPFEVMLVPEVEELRDVEFADGRRLNVQVGGNQVEERMLGIGNGDGRVNPGESIVAVVRDQGVFHLLSLRSADRCVNPAGLNLRFSDYWGNYDHVGASAKYSMPTIAADCPAGHRIAFFAEYLVPNAPEHTLNQGLVTVPVTGADTTPPAVRSAELLPGNLLETQLIEGGAVKSARATITRVSNPTFAVEVELNDKGLNGDKAAGDTWFSAVVPELPEADYRVTLEMTDDSGNRTIEIHDLVKSGP